MVPFLKLFTSYPQEKYNRKKNHEETILPLVFVAEWTSKQLVKRLASSFY